MLYWIFAGMIVYAGIIAVPSLYLVSQIGVLGYSKGRDDEPVASPYHGRAQRAARNMRENFPIFLTLAVLALVIDGTDMAQAILGAQLFVLSRIAYAPAYMSGIPFARSSVYSIGLVGVFVMAFALGG
ncbi:MAG: MAPEG family protein [Paracoccaceae bacterium]|nr:MAPEG family protein [Paracoccaceae bacterium]MDG2257072.1 MAPEG family protein [Paracoccaceae bacterium]